jgi:hypothetical protein
LLNIYYTSLKRDTKNHLIHNEIEIFECDVKIAQEIWYFIIAELSKPEKFRISRMN